VNGREKWKDNKGLVRDEKRGEEKERRGESLRESIRKGRTW